MLDIIACVEGEGLWGVTLQQRRAELGSFKLDLDSPGDTPHRISPLGQTWTRRSSLTLARFDRQKMGEHFPNEAGMRPPPPPLLTFPPIPVLLTPDHLLQILPSWLKMAYGAHGDEGKKKKKKRWVMGWGGLPFVCLWGWTCLSRSHASVLWRPRKHQLMPPSPRFWQIKTNLTGRLNHYNWRRYSRWHPVSAVSSHSCKAAKNISLPKKKKTTKNNSNKASRIKSPRPWWTQSAWMEMNTWNPAVCPEKQIRGGWKWERLILG